MRPVDSPSLQRRGSLWTCVWLACAAAALAAPLDAAAEGAFSAEVTYTGEAWGVTHGGLRRGSRYLDNLDVVLAWDTVHLPALGPSRLYAHVLYNNSGRLTEELIGDLQTVSNIDAPQAVRLYEAWWEKAFGAGGSADADAVRPGSLRLGVYDLNSEFDALETASLFLNSSHGIGPDLAQSGENGPSIFPVTGLAVRLELPLGGRRRLRLAALDAVPGSPESAGSHDFGFSERDGALLIGELERALGEQGRAFVGAWRYTKRAPRLLAGLSEPEEARARAAGLYVGAERAFGTDLAGFIRLGRATQAVHVFGRYVGAGLTWRPALSVPTTLGVAVAHARAGRDQRQVARLEGTAIAAAETALELTARLELPGGWALQPDVQYVIDPGLDPALTDALVLGLRFERSWER